MRSGSETIAQLASALAKAQAELVNPPKTLTGRIERWGTGREGQTYRYAPLSAGLDIVRQTLCRHELAVLQTTYVERENGVIMLTTTLAHGSGEWIAASWPVCRIGDMDHPQAMGAALTYARRYGLFTLVGLAGEDNLDAPASAHRVIASRTGAGGQHGVSEVRERQERPLQERAAGGERVVGPGALSGGARSALGENCSELRDAWHGEGTPRPLASPVVPEAPAHGSAPTPHRADQPQGPCALPLGVVGLPPQRRLPAARLRRGRAPRRSASGPEPKTAQAPAVAHEDEILSLAREALQLRPTLMGAERAALEAEVLARMTVLGAAIESRPAVSQRVTPSPTPTNPPPGDRHDPDSPIPAL